MTNLSSGPRSPALAASIIFITVAVCLPAVPQTEGALASRDSVNIRKMMNVDAQSSNRNEMGEFDDAEGDGYGYDDDDYDHSHSKRNDDKSDAEKSNLKSDKVKEELGEKMAKQDSKVVDGNVAIVGGSKQEAKLNDDKSNVAVDESKPKADVQSDEEKPNNKNDKVRINDAEVKKQAKTFTETRKVEEEKNKENTNVKSDKSVKVNEDNKISSSSAEKNSAIEKSVSETKGNPKEDKSGFDRKSSEPLSKKAEHNAGGNEFREDRQKEKEDVADQSHLTKLRPSQQEKSDSEISGTVKLTGSKREESLQEEEDEKGGLREELSKKSASDAEETAEVNKDPDKLQASNRENYDSLASEDLSSELDDSSDKNTEDSSQLNLPVVKLEDTEYHKNFVKSLNRFKNKQYSAEDEPDLDRYIVRNLVNDYDDDPKAARKRIRSRKIRRSKMASPQIHDLKEISRLRSKFLDILKEREAGDASREPQYRKRKSPKTLEFKIQIIDQNEAKTKSSLARSLRQKKKIRFGQGLDHRNPEKPKGFHVGKKRLIPDYETVVGKGKRDEEIIYAPSKMSCDEVEEEPKALVLVKKKQNGEKLTKTFVDGSQIKCLEDDLSSDDLAKMLAQKKEYVVLKKVPAKNEYKVYGDSESEDRGEVKETEKNEEIARPERKQKIKYASVDENDPSTSEDADTSQIRTKGFKSIEKKPKIQEEPSGLGDLFKEEEEKKSERPAADDSRHPANENEGEKEIVYVDEKADATKVKPSKDEEGPKVSSSEEKDFRPPIIKQSELNREKPQKLQDKNQGKEVIIYNGAYGARRPFTDFKYPERAASSNIRYRGPQYNGKYPQKYVVYNDNLEPKHQIKIIKNDGIIPDDRIIEMDRRIQYQKTHPQGNKVLDRPSVKNRFVDGDSGTVYAVVKPLGSRKASSAYANTEQDYYMPTKETSKRNSRSKDFFDGNDISGNFERFLKDFQELTETGNGVHRERIRASDGASVSGDQIREIKSYGDANLKNLNKILEDLLKTQNEAANPDEPGESGINSRSDEESSQVKEISKINENYLTLNADPDEMDEDELNEDADDYQAEKISGKRELPAALRKSRQSKVAPAETEDTVLENQIQQILKNFKNNKNNEGKTRRKRESDVNEIRHIVRGSRKLLSFEPRSIEKNIDPAILELFGKGERKKSGFNSFIRKREIDIGESVPNRLNDLLETSFDGTGNEKREVVKKDQPIWESKNNDEEASDQIAEDGSNRDVAKRDVLNEEGVSVESDKVNFYDSDMMPSNEWKRGNDRLVGGREKIARNIHLKRSESTRYEPPERAQRENSELKSKNEQFTIDKRTFEDMIKKYLESGQGVDMKHQNEVARNSEQTYLSGHIPKPSFQTTIDLTKLGNDHKNPVKDGKMKILPAENLFPAAKGKNVKVTFVNPGYNPNPKQNPSGGLQKNYQVEEEGEKPSKEATIKDLSEIIRKLKDFFATKRTEDLKYDSSKETDAAEIASTSKGKFEEPFNELSEEGQARASKYLDFENDPESEFDQSDQGEDNEQQDEQAEDVNDETIESRPAQSAPRLDENELTNKWSTFSNVYPKDNRKSFFKSGNRNNLGSEADKRTYFKDRRKQEILFDQDQNLGGDANTIGFANENPKSFGKKLTSNLNRINYDEFEEKGKEKKLNKWQSFQDETSFLTGKGKRDFLGNSKAAQGVHRYYPKGNRLNNYEVRKAGNTLDTGSMKRNAAKILGTNTESSGGNGSDEDLDDDVIQNIIGGYILRKSTKIRPGQGLNSIGQTEEKPTMTDDEKIEKVRESHPCFREKSKKTRKRLSSGHMTEVHFRKYHRKNWAHKRGTENLDQEEGEENEEESPSGATKFQRNGKMADAEKAADKSRNNIRITITSEEEDGSKENRRKRYEPTPKEGTEGFERVLSDPKSVERQTWSKSRSESSASASVAAAPDDGPLKVDLNDKIPWVHKKLPTAIERNEPQDDSYLLLNKKKRSVGPEDSSSLAVSNHVDKLPITNRALLVKQQSLFTDNKGGSEHQRKTAFVNKNPFGSGNSGEEKETTCPCPQSGTKTLALPRSQEANTPSSEESTKKIGEQIIDCILSRVESNPRFKDALGPSLLCQKREKSTGKEEGACSVSNKPISKKIRPLVKKLMVDLEKVVEEDEKRRSCVKMDKGTSQFLRSMLEKSDATNVEPFHNQNMFHLDSLLPKQEGAEPKNPEDSSSSSKVKNPDRDALAKKQYLFLKLIDEYQRLSPSEKAKVEPLYTYLRSQLSGGNQVSNPTLNNGKAHVHSELESTKSQISSSAERKNFKGAISKNVVQSPKINGFGESRVKDQQSRMSAANINPQRDKSKTVEKSKPTGLVLSKPSAMGYRVRTGTGSQSPAATKKFHQPTKTGYHADRSKLNRKEKIRPEKELHKLGIGDAAALQLSLGQKPWISNLDVAKGAKPQHFKMEYANPN